MALTELNELQARMSIEQRGDYSFASLAFTALFVLSTFGALVVTTLLLTAQLGRESLRTPRRLLYLKGSEEVALPSAFVRSDERLMEMLHNGKLYRRERTDGVSKNGFTTGRRGEVTVLPELRPGTGPYHVFLSHNWKHGQEKMRIVKSLLQEMVPGISVFLECAAETESELLTIARIWYRFMPLTRAFSVSVQCRQSGQRRS